MPKIKTRIKSASEDYEKNAAANMNLARELRELHETIAKGGSERAREKHLARGKLLPRDRVRSVVDRGSPFLEIGKLAYLEKGRAPVDKTANPIARQKLAAREMFLSRPLTAAL